MNIDMIIIKLILFVPCIFTFMILTYVGINGFKGVYNYPEQSLELSITDNRKVSIADRIFFICLIIFSLLFVVTDLSVLNFVDLLPMDAITTLVGLCSIPLCIITIIVGATTAEDLNEILNLNINTRRINSFEKLKLLWFYTAAFHIAIYLRHIDSTGETLRNIIV